MSPEKRKTIRGHNGQPLWLPDSSFDAGSSMGDALVDDNLKIRDKQLDTVDVVDGIMHGDTTIGAIEEWYRAQDPIGESDSLRKYLADFLLESDIKTILNERDSRQAMLLEIAALTVVEDTLPIKDDDPDTKDLEPIQKVASSQVIKALNRNDSVELPVEDFEKIQMAAEMFIDAASIIDKNPDIQNMVGGREHVANLLNDDYINALGLILFIKVNGREDLSEHKFAKLKSTSWLWSLSYFGLNQDVVRKSGGQLPNKEASLASYINDMQEFTNMERSDIRKNKGDLYEALWVLDSMMYAHVKDRDDLEVTPSLTREDKPYIGHPRMNRGFDVKVVSKSGTRLVQLKSKRNDRNETYHPMIDLIMEDNFQDINPKRLFVKLKAYEDILKGADQGTAESILQNYAIPSVIETLDNTN